MKPKLFDAISALVGGQISGSTTFESFIYHEGQTPPSKEKAEKKLAELQTEFDSQAYSRTRQQNYPNTDDLIVALWEKVMEGRGESADALEVKRQEVKTANPKPE